MWHVHWTTNFGNIRELPKISVRYMGCTGSLLIQYTFRTLKCTSLTCITFRIDIMPRVTTTTTSACNPNPKPQTKNARFIDTQSISSAELGEQTDDIWSLCSHHSRYPSVTVRHPLTRPQQTRDMPAGVCVSGASLSHYYDHVAHIITLIIAFDDWGHRKAFVLLKYRQVTWQPLTRMRVAAKLEVVDLIL